ncbi:Aminoacyl-tRNA synthetase [Aspergillus spectabilis]
MSPQLSRAVTETFVRLHSEGLIYRANRLVHWSCRLSTAFSTLEVDQKELEGSTKLSVPGYDRKVEFGSLTYFRYPIEGSGQTIEVATTRPETMLGDTGIAVHPQDERYKDLVGRTAQHPIIPDRKLRIVADEYVEREFGTGAVKLTPAHDYNDFNLGRKHNLPFINILNEDGTLNTTPG